MMQRFTRIAGVWLVLIGLFLVGATRSIQPVHAASATYCFNSYSVETWDGTPSNAVNCSTSSGSSDNNNGQYIHMNASEYTSGATGTITKVETRVYYKNNWASSQTTRNNVARLQPYFGGTAAGDTHNDATGNHSVAQWSATFDITNDTNAPDTWTWNDIASLDMRVIDYRPSSGQITVYRVEMIVTYNEVPTLSIIQPDGTADTTTVGSAYQVTYNLADSDNTVTAAFYYDTDNSGLDGTAIGGACATAAEGTGVTCSWDTTGVASGNYYIYAKTTDGTNAEVTAYSAGYVTLNPPPVVSVSITSDGTIEYGTLTSGQIKSTIQLSDTQTAKNDGNVTVNFNIKTSSPSGWSLGSTPASDIFVHEFSTNAGGSWTAFTAADTYQTLVGGVAPEATEDFDLRFTAPNPSTSASQKTITITIQAVQP